MRPRSRRPASQIRLYAEAIRCYDRALQLAPEDVVGWANRGNSLKALGQTDAALDSYQRARELDPDNAPALFGLAQVAAGRGLLEDAQTFAEETRTLDPSHDGAGRLLDALAAAA